MPSKAYYEPFLNRTRERIDLKRVYPFNQHLTPQEDEPHFENFATLYSTNATHAKSEKQ
jgi:hypothetical protein